MSRVINKDGSVTSTPEQRTAYKKWARRMNGDTRPVHIAGKSHDSRVDAKDSAALTVAALLSALLAWYLSTKHEQPETYDLTQYRPKH